MFGRRPVFSASRTPSPESSRESSPCDDRDDRSTLSNASTMSSRNTSPRPLTVAIPSSVHAQGPFCAKRPGLSEILANRAPHPYTLSAFMAYLSQNHCLETLEFTMDASRYRKHYGKMASRNQAAPLSPTDEEVQYVRMLWQKLVEAYIAPNGPREVNLPSDVRDSLLGMDASYLPPSPATLESAVNHVYSLMEESVLVPFLNSVGPLTAHPDSAVQPDDAFYSYTHYDQSSHHRQRVRDRLSSPPPTTSTSSTFSSPQSASNRQSAPSTLSQFARSLSQSARFSSARESFHNSSHSRALQLTTSTSISSASNSDTMTDDSSVSANSPTHDGHAELITPPTTPPMSEFCSYSPTATHSPRHSRGEAWKKLGGRLGWRKKSASEEDVEEPTMCMPHNY